MRFARLAVAAAALAATAAFPRAASAEEIVLASGARYDAQGVEVLEKEVRFTVVVGGGRATMVLPYDRVDGESLVGLLAARLDPRLGATHLRLARVALDRGLTGIAAYRFRRAALVDPSLAAERDAGLAAVRDLETQRLLDAAEQAMKRGRNDLAAAKAKEALASAEAGSPLAQRAQSLAELAAKTADRDRARAEREAADLAAARAAATAAAYEDALLHAEKIVEAAVVARERASDPSASPTDVRHALETAEGNLRDGRRWLAAARDRDPSHADDVDRADRDVVALLVATHLDLAEAYRLDRAFDKARDRVRAALVLDPENARATATLGRIESDLRQPPPEPYDPYGTDLGPSIGYVDGVPYVRRWVFPTARGGGFFPSPWHFRFGWHGW